MKEFIKGVISGFLVCLLVMGISKIAKSNTLPEDQEYSCACYTKEEIASVMSTMTGLNITADDLMPGWLGEYWIYFDQETDQVITVKLIDIY